MPICPQEQWIVNSPQLPYMRGISKLYLMRTAEGNGPQRVRCVTPLRWKRSRMSWGKESELCWPQGCGVFHQGAWLTSASCLDFLLCESCQSQQTNRQMDRQAERQAGRQAGSPLSEAETPGAQWLPWIHSWSLFTAVYVYCMHVCLALFWRPRTLSLD